MQKCFNNSNYLLILLYIAMLLQLLLPPLPWQLHETETFLDLKQNAFNTRNWILIKQKGLKSMGSGLGLQGWGPNKHCRTSSQGAAPSSTGRIGRNQEVATWTEKFQNTLLQLQIRKLPLHWSFNWHQVEWLGTGTQLGQYSRSPQLGLTAATAEAAGRASASLPLAKFHRASSPSSFKIPYEYIWLLAPNSYPES